jgi:hypothetical protein
MYQMDINEGWRLMGSHFIKAYDYFKGSFLSYMFSYSV